MNNIPRTSVYDFIYNTICGNVEISVIGSNNKYVETPFYEGTPNDLFDNNADIAKKLKGWQAETIWVDNGGVLVITCEGGRDTEWLSEYGRDPKGWYDKEMERTYGPDWYLRDDI